MKRYLIVVAALLAACTSAEKPPEGVPGRLNVIPLPTSVRLLPGEFELTPATMILAGSEAEVHAGELLRDELRLQKNIDVAVVAAAPEGQPSVIELHERPPTDRLAAWDEVYKITSGPRRLVVTGAPHGLLNGVQTLLQVVSDKGGSLTVPAAVIDDAPRFRYRGMLLDVARHFMPADFIKKYIREIARYKFNYLHLHLTDDQGWRIEIRKYPRLTEIGSKRKETVVDTVYKAYAGYKGDGKPVGGFYTQDELRDLVAYAAAHNVTIVPEIDVPGHASAALAAYQEYGCRAGNKYEVKTTWGGSPDVICPSERSVEFVTDVISEVADIFPGSPIHIGGDEFDSTDWRNSAAVAELKHASGLADELQVQHWWIAKIIGKVRERGIKLMVWDDTIPSQTDPSLAITVWHDDKDAITRAARLPNEVIMMPSEQTYFDHPSGDPADEGRITLGPPVTLEKVYSFDPVPQGENAAERDNIIGGQGCVWTEFITSGDEVEKMSFPRAIALAEALWTARSARDINFFRERLSLEFAHLDRENVAYRLPGPFGATGERRLAPNEKAIVNLGMALAGGRIFYTDDGSVPTVASRSYNGAFLLDVPLGQTRQVKSIFVSASGRQSAVATCTYSRMLPGVALPALPPKTK